MSSTRSGTAATLTAATSSTLSYARPLGDEAGRPFGSRQAVALEGLEAEGPGPRERIADDLQELAFPAAVSASEDRREPEKTFAAPIAWRRGTPASSVRSRRSTSGCASSAGSQGIRREIAQISPLSTPRRSRRRRATASASRETASSPFNVDDALMELVPVLVERRSATSCRRPRITATRTWSTTAPTRTMSSPL